MTNDEPDFEYQLDQIRMRIYERQKALSPQEAADETNRLAKTIAEEFGIIISDIPAPTRVNKPRIAL